jgi:hypothetical protein
MANLTRVAFFFLTYGAVIVMFLLAMALDQIPDPVAAGIIPADDEERNLESKGTMSKKRSGSTSK